LRVLPAEQLLAFQAFFSPIIDIKLVIAPAAGKPEESMKPRHWAVLLVVAFFALCANAARAQDDNDQGHGHGRGHEKHGDWDHHSYDQNRDAIRHWYRDREDRHDLPPGLAKRDQLPPGLERHLVLRGTLPPGLRRRIEPCPEDLERRLPPPPEGYEHVIIGGHIVLLNRKSYFVLDIFHFERN
jgi:Ni/Co efflux regulator RcnB